MKQLCKCAFRDYLTQILYKARKDGNLTQAKFAEKLMMDTRSYVCLEHGENLCCTFTFILYLVLFCKDVNGLVSDLRQILFEVFDDDRFAS